MARHIVIRLAPRSDFVQSDQRVELDRCDGLDWSKDWILEWSFSVSTMIVVQRMGMERNVAQRDDASCSCVNMGWRLVKFMLA